MDLNCVQHLGLLKQKHRLLQGLLCEADGEGLNTSVRILPNIFIQVTDLINFRDNAEAGFAM